MTRTIRISIAALLLLSGVAAVMSCSERIQGNRKDVGVIGLSAQLASPQTQDSIYFRLLVQAPDWRLEPPLLLKDSAGWLVGEIDVPAGRGRIFTVEGFDSTYVNDVLEEVIIYKGVDTIDVVAGQRNAVGISLQPVKPMIRVSPRFKHVLPYDTFSVSVKLYDTSRYTGIIYRVTYDPSLMQFDSASVGADLDPALTFYYNDDSSHTFVTFTSYPRQAPPNGLFASGRSGTLATLHFLSYYPQQALDTTMLNTYYVSLRDSAGVDTYPSLFSGGCLLTIGFDPTASYEITGQVLDAATGQPLADAVVTVRDAEFAAKPTLFEDSTRTNAQGEYRIAGVPEGFFQIIIGKAGYISSYEYLTMTGNVRLDPIVLSRELAVGAYRFVLSWGQYPTDLDAHLWVQPAAASFEVYWGSLGDSIAPPFAYLDVDNVVGYGPETITITQLYAPCKFAVNNYSVDTALIYSHAHVDLYQGSQRIRTFDIPTQGAGEWWYVCDIDASGLITYRNVITVTPPVGAAMARQSKGTPQAAR